MAAAQNWVKCHAALTKGSKRMLSRATRFVFLELCLEARESDEAGVVEIRPDLELPAAVYDLIGGNLQEIADAMNELRAARMVDEAADDTGHFIIIPSWDKWNRPDPSTDRVKRHRERKRDETPRNVSVTPACNDVNVLEERRGEEKREEEVVIAREAPPPPPPPPASEEESHIRDGLAGLSSAADFAPACQRLATRVRALAPEERWPDLPAEVQEWLAHARKAYQDARIAGHHWDPDRTLSEVESKATQRIRYRPKDARMERERARARATTHPDGSARSPATLETDTLAEEIARADQRLEAERKKRAEEQRPDPASMAAAAKSALARLNRGAA